MEKIDLPADYQVSELFMMFLELDKTTEIGLRSLRKLNTALTVGLLTNEDKVLTRKEC